jgi:hypothetical protein
MPKWNIPENEDISSRHFSIRGPFPRRAETVGLFRGEDLSRHEYRGNSAPVTGHRSPVDWYPLFPNPVVAESLLGRLINTSTKCS